MFDNIVTNNEINFNELEQKIYKFVCDLDCYMLKEIIEKYDVKIQMKEIWKIIDIEDLKQIP